MDQIVRIIGYGWITMSKAIINGELEVTGGTFPLSKIMKPDGTFETAQVGTEYISPNQHGGYFGTVYRQYFTGTLLHPTTVLIASFVYEAIASGGFIIIDPAAFSFYQLPTFWASDYIQKPRMVASNLAIYKNHSTSTNKTFYAWVDYFKP